MPLRCKMLASGKEGVKGIQELSMLFLQLSWKSKPVSKQKVILKMSYWVIASNETKKRERSKTSRKSGPRADGGGGCGQRDKCIYRSEKFKAISGWHLSLTKKRSSHGLNWGRTEMEDLDSGEILSKATAYNGTERMPGGMWRISECPGWLLGTFFFSDYGYSILEFKNIRALVV